MAGILPRPFSACSAYSAVNSISVGPIPPARRGARFFIRSNPHNESNLQSARLIKGCFWPKNGAVWQKIEGPTEIILHFFLCFPGFCRCLHLQAVAFQPQAAIPPLPQKSRLKTYRRFFVRPGICHNPRMNDEKFATSNAFGARVERPAAVPSRQCPFDATGKTLRAYPSHLSHSSHPFFLNDLT
jgi:hypothetical protein